MQLPWVSRRAYDDLKDALAYTRQELERERSRSLPRQVAPTMEIGGQVVPADSTTMLDDSILWAIAEVAGLGESPMRDHLLKYAVMETGRGTAVKAIVRAIEEGR